MISMICEKPRNYEWFNRGPLSLENNPKNQINSSVSHTAAMQKQYEIREYASFFHLH